MLKSQNVPDVNYSPDIQDLFRYFGYSWDTISPAVYLLCGVLLAFFLLTILKKTYFGD